MKVIGIVNNYDIDNSGIKSFPDMFLLADSSLLKDGKPFFLPDFDSEFKVYPSLVVRVNRLGKNIAPRFANRYYDAVTIGLNVRAESKLKEMVQNKIPWASAVAFDGSAIMGEFESKENIDFRNLKFEICKNDKEIYVWEYAKLLTNIDELISQISKRFTLKIGDYIYIGLSGDGFDIKIDDVIIGKICEKEMLNFKIK